MQSLAADFFFTLVVLLTVIPAVMVVLTLNIVRAACWLLVSLSGAAGLFFFLGADFVGATQLLIYVGGTLVLVIFGVMLTATGPFVQLASRSTEWSLAVVGGVLLLGVLAYALSLPIWRDADRFPPELADAQPIATTNEIGLAFLGFTTAPDVPRRAPAAIPAPTPRSVGYLLPFEIVSVHLLVVLIGAAYLARAKQRKTRLES